MQLQINTKLDVINEINTNFDEVKKFYIEKLDKYKGLTYGVDQIQEAKKDRASLNKETKALKNILTDTKKILLNPMAKLDTDIKELVVLVDGVSCTIDEQVKFAEQKERLIKGELITGLFTETCNFKELNIGLIFQDNWMNSTYTMKKVQEDIVGHLAFVAKDLAIIEGLNSKFEDNLKKLYFEALDLTAVIDSKNNMEEAERVVLEKQKEVEEIKEEKPMEEKKEEVMDKVFDTVEVKDNEFQVVLQITTTIGQMNALKEFCSMNKINYVKL
jgi:hypothetical protein